MVNVNSEPALVPGTLSRRHEWEKKLENLEESYVDTKAVKLHSDRNLELRI